MWWSSWMRIAGSSEARFESLLRVRFKPLDLRRRSTSCGHLKAAVSAAFRHSLSWFARLGVPCQLTGTGMAFPWPLFRDAPPTESFLVEDLLLGHELALRGHPPVLCADILVGSDLPRDEEAGFKQRRRWEHGELDVLLRSAPRLVRAGLASGRLGLVAMGLDSMVPPLAFLTLAQVAACGVGVTAAIFAGTLLPLEVALAGTALGAVGIGVAWTFHGRRVLPLREVVRIPGYVLWKLPLYATFLRRGAHAEWERTARDDK